MTCNSCGNPIPDGAKFCGLCGATHTPPAQPAPAYQEATQPAQPETPAYAAAPVYPEEPVQAQPPYQPQPVYPQPYYQPVAEELPPQGRYAPISALGYFGYLFAFGVPILGLILSIVWSGDKTGNINRQNLAKLMLFFKILGVVLLIGMIILGFVFADEFAAIFDEAMQQAQMDGFDPNFYMY